MTLKVTDEKMTSPLKSLLGVDSGVENRIVSFVATGVGSLRDILNLRLVCRTTKSWVDHLPKPQADVVFSKAQVVVHLDLLDLTEFLLTPPPFGVTALYLLEGLNYMMRAVHATETADHFKSYWNSKLETLDIKTELRFQYPSYGDFIELMESPNLVRLQLDPKHSGFDSDTRLPDGFQKVRELTMGTINMSDPHRSEFFSQLKNNCNLRVFTVCLVDIEDFVGVSKLLNHKKDQTQLHVNLDLKYNQNLWKSHADLELFHDFVSSVVSSASKIRIQNISNLGDFKTMAKKLLPPDVSLDLCKSIESAQRWIPTKETLSQLQDFPCLKSLRNVDIRDSSVHFGGLVFPPSLQELRFRNGIPSCEYFPSSLTSLYLHDMEWEINSFLDCLNLLSGRCSQLNSLLIKNHILNSPAEKPRVEFPIVSGFSNLKKLTINCLIMSDHMEDCLAAFSNGFNFKNLQLSHLNLDIQSRHAIYPLVDEQILRPFCEGLSARSLERVEIECDSVTEEAFPLLSKLWSLADENVRKQDETEGRTRRHRNDGDLL